MDYIFHYLSPIGGLILTSDGTHLTGLHFEKQKYGAAVGEEPCQAQILPIFQQTIRWLNIYFSGREPDFTPLLKIQTTCFRKQVWEMMLHIPYGQTTTYGAIAVQMARKNGLKKMSAQAVGGAVGHNAIAIIIPCHRVLGADGSLTGYAGGLAKKIKLLQLEKALIKRMVF